MRCWAASTRERRTRRRCSPRRPTCTNWSWTRGLCPCAGRRPRIRPGGGPALRHGAGDEPAAGPPRRRCLGRGRGAANGVGRPRGTGPSRRRSNWPTPRCGNSAAAGTRGNSPRRPPCWRTPAGPTSMVRVRWSGDADVDLTVTEPAGTVHRPPTARRSAGGGVLGAGRVRAGPEVRGGGVPLPRRLQRRSIC